MSVQRGRIPAVLVLANYVLALTVGEGLHVHAPPSSARPSGTCCSDLRHGPTDGPTDHSLCRVHQIADRAGSLPRSCQSGKCPVCQFLAQKPVPEQPIERVVCAGPTCDLVVIEPVRWAARVTRAHTIRGPPSVA